MNFYSGWLQRQNVNTCLEDRASFVSYLLVVKEKVPTGLVDFLNFSNDLEKRPDIV